MSSAFQWQPSAVPVQQRLNQFAEYIDRVHLGWHLDQYSQKSFNARVRGRQFDEVIFTDVTVDAICGQRDNSEISRLREEHYCFISILEGEEVLNQGDNVAVLKPGDVTIWHTSRPATFSSTRRTRQLSLFVPGDMVERRFPNVADFCGRRLDGGFGFGALLKSYFSTIPRVYEQLDADSAICLVDPVVDMMSGAFSKTDEEGKDTRHRHRLLARVRTYISDNAGDPELTPGIVACHFGFSQRYLHKIFSATGSTPGGYIRQQRLMRARAELRKPVGRALSITELAFRSGFSDSSHFSKVFKQAFGVSPREYRQRH